MSGLRSSIGRGFPGGIRAVHLRERMENHLAIIVRRAASAETPSSRWSRRIAADVTRAIREFHMDRDQAIRRVARSLCQEMLAAWCARGPALETLRER